MNWKKNFKSWVKNKNLPLYIKETFKNKSLDELKLAFNSELEFGTSGIRAKLGYGSAYLNIITIRRISLAFAEYLISNFNESNLQKKGVIIAHDNRKSSLKFSLEMISVLNSFNIKCVIFESNKYMSTPTFSYGVRKMNLISGILITANHNHKNYNGIKFFDSNGCEFLPSITDEIMDFYNNNTTEAINFTSNIEHTDLIEIINDKIQEKYISEVLKIQLAPLKNKDIKIVFSNLHGTSKEITPEILKRAGYKNIIIVKEQHNLDDNFTYAPNPNPELKENYTLAHKYATSEKADLVLLNDPDADRIGVSILHNNRYYIIQANELAPILLYYIVNCYKNKSSSFFKNWSIYSSLVSSELYELIAKDKNIKVKKTLPGFKWISHEIVKNKNKRNIFSFEESNSFKVSDLVNDKDAMQTSLLVAEAINYYKQNDKTFINVLNEIYSKYGYYYTETITKSFKDDKKDLYINNIMETLRYKRIDYLGELKIINKEDYINSFDGYHPENLIKFYFEDNSWMAIRPSGTEPKIKFYFVFNNNESILLAKKQMHLVKDDLFNNYLNI